MVTEPKRHKRRLLIVDKPTQFKLLGYAGFVGVSSSVFTSIFVSLWYAPEDELAPMKLALLALIGIITFSLVIILGMILSHQICGPIYRLHSEVRAALSGRGAGRIQLRRGDHFKDLIADFNRLSERIERKDGESGP